MANPRKPVNHVFTEKIERLESQLESARAELAICRRPTIRRDEIIPIERFMSVLGIKDKRTALKVLKSLGMPTEAHCGVVFVNGLSLFSRTSGGDVPCADNE